MSIKFHLHLKTLTIIIVSIAITTSFVSCAGDKNFLDEGIKLIPGDMPQEPGDPENPGSPQDPVTPQTPGGSGNDNANPGVYKQGMHPMFSGMLGVPIASSDSIMMSSDPTGLDAMSDYDGDGIANENEVVTNPYVADCPRIVTRIVAPIIMSIRISEDREEENYSQTINENDMKSTLKNSMEDKHYTQAQKKTTPYVVKESLSEGGKQAQSYGYSNASSSKDAFNYNMAIGSEKTFLLSTGFGVDNERSRSNSNGASVENEFSRSSMSEYTEFDDVDYTDNLDRNGFEFKSDTIENIVNKYSQSTIVKQKEKTGPNDGYVRASLYIRNTSLNIPVRISNVQCNLAFKTPGGLRQPIKTFKLLNDDYSEFDQEIYGDEEIGPFTIDIQNLLTSEVRTALANGYMPIVTVVSYNMNRVKDSNYNPGFDNLKIVEESAKGRTATIKIVGNGLREIYRVAAFDVKYSGPDGLTASVTPGISLKKALFKIYADRIGTGETWERDRDDDELTVADEGLRWEVNGPDKQNDHIYSKRVIDTAGKTGNNWHRFETYVREYIDKDGTPRNLEAIKRIDMLTKYDPFSSDNVAYNANEVLSIDEVRKMKFWVVLYKGQYYRGDINDPIWPGERYEIVCMDMQDLNERIQSFAYTPFQSGEDVLLNTRWNQLSEQEGEFARAIHLGKVFPNEIIKLNINLLESRYLFDENNSKDGFGSPDLLKDDKSNTNIYYNFNYKFYKESTANSGIPQAFSHSVVGGVNSIEVKINESKNALSYSIKISYPEKLAGEEETSEETALRLKIGAPQTVTVSPADLAKNNGVIVLNSQTFKPIIGGTPSAIPYVVEVEAFGKKFNNDFSRENSSSKGQVAYVLDAGENKPGPFEFTAAGAPDSLYVKIGGASNTEWYDIICTGPENFPSLSKEVKTIGHSGFNNVSFYSPSFKELANNKFANGIYKIQIFARNNNKGENKVEAYNGAVWTEVSYDRYNQQRQYAPHISKNLLDFSAIDLEVNFNEGSGWFKLQMVDPYSEKGMLQGPEKRVIDCYHSSNMDVYKQKFEVKFMPPNGQYAGMPNIFRGGKEITDVYVRTINKMKYRDTFWMIPSSSANGEPYKNYSSADRYFKYNGVVCKNDDITDIWLNKGTDATNISDLGTSLDPIVSLSSNDVDNFFFSPKEEHVYSIVASVSDDETIIQGLRPNMPSFRSDPKMSPAAIDIKDILSANSSSFEIYFSDETLDFEKIQQDGRVDITGASWVNNKKWDKRYALSYPSNSYLIPGLAQGSDYTICVAARNKYGLSMPNCEVVTISQPPLQLPTNVKFKTVQTVPEGLLITGVSAQGAAGFTAFYKNKFLFGDEPPSLPWKVAPFDKIGSWHSSSILIRIPQTEIPNTIVYIYAYNENNSYCEEKERAEWPLRSNVSLVEDAAIMTDYAAGSFPIADNEKFVNINQNNLAEGMDFKYGNPLDGGTYNIFDTGVSGQLGNNACLRLVVNGMNIISDLDLHPVAYDLISYVTPPANTVYVDPIRGEFVLPRPVFWSKMEGPDSEIGSYTFSQPGTPNEPFCYYGNNQAPKPKFNNGLYIYNNPAIDNTNGVLSTISFNNLNQRSGTISFWNSNCANVSATQLPQPYQVSVAVAWGPSTRIVFDTTSASSSNKDAVMNNTIYIDGEFKCRDTSISLISTNPRHFYITYDITKGITVYVDGKEKLKTEVDSSWSYCIPYLIFSRHCAKNMYVFTSIDNIKVWNHVVDEKPYFDYYDGFGREDALHPVYGPENNYVPNTVSVGYYKKPQ